ncbi:MAG: hypothetical protein JNJ55_13380 [Betaproteobacteria bacterium]|nr:hypothetical protein [Betaproteobacteria bacterium]
MSDAVHSSGGGAPVNWHLRLCHLSQRVSAPVFVTLAWAFIASPWLSGLRVIPYDALDEFFPASAFVARSILAGDSPFWNPWIFAGYPQIADPQGMTFSPGIVLPMLASPSLVMFNWAIMLHLLVAGMGIARLGRIQGWNTSATVMAATIFMFGAQSSSRLQHVPMIVSFAFLPWVLASLHGVFNQRRWRDAAMLGILAGLTGLQLTQITHLCALLAGAYATFLMIGSWRAGHARGLPKALLLLAAAGLIGILIAAPQIVATLSILEFTDRGRFDYETASAFSMRAFNFLSILGANVLGNLQGTYVGTRDVTES